MNLEIHHSGKRDYFDNLKDKFEKKIQRIKNNRLLTSKNKKVRIKAIKRSFLKEKKETEYNNF